MRIVFTADCHLTNHGYKRTRFGVSERSFDFLNQIATVAMYAIENDASIFAIAGDLYDKTTINPNVKRILRNNVIKPLLKKNIKIIIIGGNHDSHKELAFGCDIEELNMASNITVRRMPGVKKYKIDDERIGFVLHPFMMPETAFDYIVNSNKAFDASKFVITPQTIMEYFDISSQSYLKSLEGVDARILMGHYHVVGTMVTNLPASFSLKEIEFTRAMIREQDIDLAVFGHIHKHQHLGEKIVVPGSIERVNFGERNDDKFFIDYDTSTKKWQAIPLECRKMIQVDADVSNNETNPTASIVSMIKDHDLQDAIIKISITTTRAIKRKIDQYSLERELGTAFHPVIEYKVIDDTRDPMINLSGLNLDPESLLAMFIDSKYGDRLEAYRTKLLQKSLAYMREE